VEPEPTATPEESIALDPTPAELEAWVASERRRREAWLKGPTADEQAAYAQRVRDERLAELQGPDARLTDRMRQMKVYPREAQLAAEGAMSLLLKWSRQGFAELVRAGRAWEEEVSEPRRRRVPIDDEPASSGDAPSSRRVTGD
jgi:hypothetical protein